MKKLDTSNLSLVAAGLANNVSELSLRSGCKPRKANRHKYHRQDRPGKSRHPKFGIL